MPINYKHYPPNWKEIRERIIRRAGNKCEGCGIPNHALVLRGFINEVPVYQDCWDKEGAVYHADTSEYLGITYVGDIERPAKNLTRIVLTIAHLDHDKENHDVKDERLRAWCQRCHLNYDRPRHVQKRKASRQKKTGQMDFFNPAGNK